MDTDQFGAELWRDVCHELQKSLSKPTYATWIHPVGGARFDGQCLELLAPSTFAANWLRKSYQDLISHLASRIAQQPVQVLIKDAPPSQPSTKVVLPDAPSADLPEIDPAPQARIAGSPTPCRQSTKGRGLNPRYLFSRFVVGGNSHMAHAACMAVAESTSQSFNPLFLCGNAGLGKTHLMQAIGHQRLQTNPKDRVLYVTTEQFTNEMITAIRKDRMQSFRESYREADLVLVDDIQFIQGKEYTQEEFFHTFNWLHESGRQVVLASDRPPGRICRIQKRLISRFSMGLVADIQSPDLETRMAILHKKADQDKVKLPEELTHYIACHFTANIRELEGALTRAVAYCSITGQPLTTKTVAPILNLSAEPAQMSPKRVIESVAQVFAVEANDLQGSSRKRAVSRARQAAMYLLRQHTDLSLGKIGQRFGGKNHTTVLYAVRRVGKALDNDTELAQQLTRVRNLLGEWSNNIT
ncbi:MAG: chromosomal replication initiation protein [Candidatus Synechococcus spongiarum SP3]|uniref:Chromosomal replication initiator protein DnaA n=1 Tax=Candidatus Synechococcus spongiarum SP3 TaxID=1604020 RepID=A0A0G2IVY2_9SYNE|nr:MAG: chromosomal replication initiation protein [Candidatus Synechococcus spongiarum SP3]